ncbi:disulfide bond formation protein B [Noviherbaspirillum cavernae]|uniref:Disulfide bond formation protein B n=1 Tax=Noviherbaspirillum cavernae TaxID=2320862 RepID=A0A418X4L9_9BURK|nr:disulfide bond formation protein B [Noviherbaspirillum cavernae]RJG07366.1 disulfide bond formation protein B [Noviherbaspirillum cavernae]
MDTTKDTVWPLVFACWLVATASTLGAIFLGEVMGLTPCILCWYQRICMFPLVLVLAGALFPLDTRVVRYAFPLAFAGLGIAVFHLLVSEGIVSEAVTPCTPGVPCSQQLIEWFGFLTIPMLSVAAFLIINAMLIAIYFKAFK